MGRTLIELGGKIGGHVTSDDQFDMEAEGQIFEDTFQFLDDALGDAAFKRWNGQGFAGKFLMSVFEVMATGVSKNVRALKAMDAEDRRLFICEAAKRLWQNEVFQQNSGAGVRGTTRLSRLLPIAADLLRP